LTQVVARPVNTAVAPGLAGMPQAPVAPVAPTPISNQPAVDLQNLASSLGQLSRSLADLGTAQLQSQEREEQRVKEQDSAIKRAEAEQRAQLEKADRNRKEAEAIRRRNEADAEAKANKLQREADRAEAEAKRLGEKIGQLINLDDVDTMAKVKAQMDTMLSKDEISISEHSAYSEAMSMTVARRYAERDTSRDVSALEGLHARMDDEIKDPNWFSRWYKTRTESVIRDVPKWIPDKDAFNARYLSARSDAKVGLLRTHERVIGVAQAKDEQHFLENETHVLLNEALDPFFSIVPEEGEGSVLDPAAFAAEKVTKLLDNHRITGVSTVLQANNIVADAVFNWLRSQDTSAGMDAGIAILERIQTGPRNSRTKLLSGEALVKWQNEVEPALEVKQDKILAAEAKQAFIDSSKTLEKTWTDFFLKKIRTDAVPGEALAEDGARKLEETLKGVYSTENPQQAAAEKAFHESFLKNGGSYDPATKTIKLEKDGNTHSFSLDKLARNAKEEALVEDMVIQRNAILARMKSDPALRIVPEVGEGSVLARTEDFSVSYIQENGEPFPDSMIDVFAKAASIRSLQYNESNSLKAQVDQMVTGDYLTEQEAMTNLQGAMTVYKILSSNKDTNPTLASDVLGEETAKFLLIANEMHRQKALPGISPIATLNGLMRDGKFDPVAIEETVTKVGPTGETTIMEDINAEVFRKQQELANVFVPFATRRGTAQAQVTRLARMFAGVAGVEPERAVEMAVATVTNDMADVGGYRFPMSLLTPATAAGASPLMRRNPDWQPPTAEEKLTRAQQKQKRDKFLKAKADYEDFWVKHRKIQIFEQKFLPPTEPTFSKSLRELEKLRREGKLRKGDLQPEDIVPGQPGVERIDVVPRSQGLDKKIKEINDYAFKINRLKEKDSKKVLNYLHGLKGKTIPPNAWLDIGFKNSLPLRRHLNILKKAGLIEWNAADNSIPPKLLGDPTKKPMYDDYRIRIPAKSGRYEYNYTSEYKKYQHKLRTLEENLRKAEGKEIEAYEDFRKKVFPKLTPEIRDTFNPFEKYESTSNFEVDVLRKDPGNMTGLEMLNTASKAFRIGSTVIGETGLASRLYKEAIDKVGRVGADKMVFVPVPGRKDRFVLLRPTESAMTRVLRVDGTSEYSLAEVAAIAQATFKRSSQAKIDNEELKRFLRSQRSGADNILRFGGR